MAAVDSLRDVLASSSLSTTTTSPPPPPLLASTDALNYLNHLTTLPLKTLIQEQPVLTTQSHHLTSSLTSLCNSSYSTFLSLHTTANSLSSSLSSLSSTVTTLLDDSLPALHDTASAFRAGTEPVLKERAKARQVLEQHDKIRDLLDIPVLIDTCVRNGYFSEALSLAAHTASLSASSPSSPIIQSIQHEVSLSLRTLLHTLFQTLYEPNRKLPALWKAVTFLRRMDVMLEDELALAFLIGRAECLTSALWALGAGREGDDDGDARARYLRKYVDVWREGVYDIIVQYTTIFLSPPAPTPISPSKPKLTIATTPATASTPTASFPHLRALLTTHAHHLLTKRLLPTLHAHLPHVPSNTFPSLLTQLTYCATAFARVGLDFRVVVGGIVTRAVHDRIARMYNDAAETWCAKLRATDRTTMSSWWARTPPHADQPPLPPPGPSTGPPNVPPGILTAYPPLAEFANALLDALNTLRVLAPLDLAGALWDEQERALGACAGALLALVKEAAAASPSGAEPERGEAVAVVDAVGLVFVRVLVPFIRRGFVEGVYGATYKPDTVSHAEGDVWSEWEAWLSREKGDINS
jgi:hypothetical protein